MKKNGYRLTPQRRAVINILAYSQGHLSPEEIHERVSQGYPGIGLVTIYRTLDILLEMGLVCRVHTEGKCRSYLLSRPSEHHHHLVCSGCGQVIDFTSCNLDGLEQKLAKETGFEVDSHLLEFYGLCRTCKTK